ncbi:recombinase RecT, partial [Staphylococcus epidermidis]|uniref:recombinase RecT n=1 Tax=Staphylococcus epidermidis TaxID=1282 RepID=UPI00164304EF
PANNQSYFIPYPNKIQIQPTYHPNIIMLKPDPPPKHVLPQIIYKAHSFKQHLHPTAPINHIKHQQHFFNIHKDNILAPYSTILFHHHPDNYIQIMNIHQINQPSIHSSIIKHQQPLHKSKTHNNFKQQIPKKTLINPPPKPYINTSTHHNLLKFPRHSQTPQPKQLLDAELQQNPNQQQLHFHQPQYQEP